MNYLRLNRLFSISFNIILFCIPISLFGQDYFVKRYWTNSALIRSSGIYHTSDNGYIQYGDYYLSNFNILQGLVIKTNMHGDTLWTLRISDPTDTLLFVSPKAVTEIANSGEYLISFECSPPLSNHLWTIQVRVDYSGNILQQTKWQHPGGSHVFEILAMDNGINGNCYMTGWVSANWHGQIVILKDSSGLIKWQNLIHGLDLLGVKATHNIDALSDGSMIIASQISPNLCLVKLDFSGQLQWAKVYGDTSYKYYPTIVRYGHDRIYVAGRRGNFSNEEIPFLLVTDTTGNVIRYNEYGALNTVENSISDITFDDFGNVYGIITFWGGYVFKCDPDGDILWYKNLGTSAASASQSDGITLTDHHTLLISYESAWKAGLMEIDTSGFTPCYFQTTSTTHTTLNMPFASFTPIISADTLQDSVAAFSAKRGLTNVSMMCFGASTDEISINDRIIIASPNPMSEGTSITYYSEKSNVGSYSIINLNGEIIRDEIIPVNSGSNTFYISTENIASGLYVLTINLPENILRTKILIQTDK